MRGMIIAQAVPILSDNYAWLLRDSGSGAVGIVDPADAAPVAAAIDAAGGRLDLILLTHHHDDHIAGTDAIRARYGAQVVGAKADARRLPKLDRELVEGDEIMLGAASGRVIDTPGHTRGHISFFFPDGDVLICGDTLFSLGCGRLLEGTPSDMFASLQKFAALPADTLVCCGHEYTQSNARFALSADPSNAALKDFAAHVDTLRAAGKPTIPSRLGDEMAANPFLRAPDVATLGDLRARKDKF
jgi:hydroxyacylglutathione hydrolase